MSDELLEDECELCGLDSVIECDSCEGRGKINQCSDCEGRGWVDDLSDGGTMNCPRCKNDEENFDDCSDCEGSGEIPCPECEG